MIKKHLIVTICRAALDSVPNTESSVAIVEPSIFHNQALFSKFYMTVDGCRTHSCLFLYHELQFWTFKIDFQNLPLFSFVICKNMKKIKIFIKKIRNGSSLVQTIG